MTTPQQQSDFHVRRNWLRLVIDELQTAAGQVELIDRVDAQKFLTTFPHLLPAPQCSAEQMILRSLLIEFAGDSGTALHAGLHHLHRNERCTFVPAVTLECFWKPRRLGPEDGMRAWAHAFFNRLAKVHPVTVAAHAAHLLRHHYKDAWDISTLAKQVHSTPSKLTRAFRHEYRRSPRAYLRDIRLVMAIDRLRDEKIESIALDVG